MEELYAQKAFGLRNRLGVTSNVGAEGNVRESFDKLIAKERTAQEHWKEQALRYAELLLRRQTNAVAPVSFKEVVEADAGESNKRLDTSGWLTWSFDSRTNIA
jgi:biotin carboxylase